MNVKNAIKLLNWLAHSYGFATYLHKVEGYYSKTTTLKAEEELQRLLIEAGENNSVFIDTIISPSYTSAIAQAIQMPGISGLENNIVLFEFKKDDNNELLKAIDNFNLVKAGKFDVLFLASDTKRINYKEGIHIWINVTDETNINLMVMLSFIILNHDDWKKANIKTFVIIKPEVENTFKRDFIKMVKSGRIPIMLSNIEFITQDENTSIKSLIITNSKQAGLIITGIHAELINRGEQSTFINCTELGDILHVYSQRKIPIE